EWAMVGSANLDVRSHRLNYELNTLVRDPQTAAELERVLIEDFEHGSRRIIPEKFLHRPRWQRFQESLVRPLAPLL
ncbi:MAG: clsA 1, partial [Spartobacteria bacterium]|nr:clsA 1 [Spartobacteria bacterium]